MYRAISVPSKFSRTVETTHTDEPLVRLAWNSRKSSPTSMSARVNTHGSQPLNWYDSDPAGSPTCACLMVTFTAYLAKSYPAEPLHRPRRCSGTLPFPVRGGEVDGLPVPFASRESGSSG